MTSFNPALYLYLNPQLSAYSNVISVNDAQSFYIANSNNTNFLVDMSEIPGRFDEYVYISDYKKCIDISGLNKTIKLALSNQGLSMQEIEDNGKYVSTIFQDVTLINSNVFKFNNLVFCYSNNVYGSNCNCPCPCSNAAFSNTYSNASSNCKFFITACNLNVGDSVKIVKNNVHTYYATVSNIIDGETILLYNRNYSFTDFTGSYILYGIKLYDPYRIATINYLQSLQSNYGAPPATDLYYDDVNFNPDLYRMLYPDTRHLEDSAAYIDFVCRKDNHDFRIGRTRDLVTTIQEYPSTFYSLRVLSCLNLDFDQNTGYFKWGNTIMKYVSQDDVRSAADIPLGAEGLITERAIKSYIDYKFLVEAVFNDITVNGTTILNSNVDVNGPAIFNNTVLFNSNVALMPGSTFTVSNDVITDFWSPVTSHCNLRVLGSNNFFLNATACNFTVQGETMQVETDADFINNVGVTGALLGPRIGIGPYVAPIDENTLRLDKNLLTVASLVASSNMTVGTSNVTEASICLKVHGLVEAANVSAVSDRRLKKDAQVISGEDLLRSVSTTDIYKFTWRHKQQRTVGFIAQELEKTFPEAVSIIPRYEVPCNFNLKVVKHCRDLKVILQINSNVLDEIDEANVLVFDDLYTISRNDLEICDRGVWGIVVNSSLHPNLYNHLTHQSVCTLTKIIYEDLKIVDYQYMSCALFASVKELSQRLKTLEDIMK